MANSPTIISASLDDKEMRQSIANLVAYVKRATQTMSGDLDAAVEKMNASLKKLGTPASGGSANTSAAKQDTQSVEENTAARKKNAQAVKEQKLALDQMAEAQKQAVAPKSARESYLAFEQGFKAQGEAIARQIKDAEAALNKAVENRVNELNAKLTNAKAKLNELNVELAKQRMNAERTGNYSTYNAGITRTTQAIEYQMKHIAELQKKISEVSPNMFTQQVQGISALRREYERVANIMKEEVSAKKDSSQATQQQLTEEQRLTEEVRKRAKAIRESEQWKTKGFAEMDGFGYYDQERIKGTKQHKKEIGTLEEQILRHMQQQGITERQNEEEAKRHLATVKSTVEEAREYFKLSGGVPFKPNLRTEGWVYEENDVRAKGLTIEQQVEALLKQEGETLKGNTSETQQRLRVEEQITEEQKKRKYVAPTVSGDERFKSMVAKAAGINKSEITVNTTEIQRLTTYVKQLQSAYVNLTSEERKSPFGRLLREELQLTERAVQKFRSEMSRPISFGDAMRLPEKTLDDIQYKIRQLQSYKMGIHITKPNAQNEIKQVDDAINKLQKDMNKYMNTGKGVMEQNNALGRSWNYMKNRLAFYFTVGAGTQFVKQLVEIRSQYEMNERALGILIGSAEYGSKIFSELSQMSLVSPYTLIELSSAAKQLTAYDIAARDVVDTTRRLADMSAAVGIPIERLTYALGQIKAYGFLNSRDARMFSNAGIPLVKELADYYTQLEGKMVSTADVYDRMKKHSIEYADVMQVINKMTDEGGKFFDFQAKMADTLKVRLANLTLAWNNMLNDIGKSEQGVLTSGIKGLTVLFRHWQDFAATLRNVAIGFGLAKAAQILYISYTQKVGIATAFADASSKKLVGTMYSLKAGITSLITSPMTWWLLLATAVTSAGMAFYDANQKLKEFNNTLREGGAENVKNINSYLESMESLRKKLEQVQLDETNSPKKTSTGAIATVKTNIDESEAKKAWEAMREQIELASSSSSVYIQRLLQIENVSERLREGFAILENIKAVSQALSEVSDNTFKVEQSFSGWWNLWTLQDGLIQNLKDYNDALEGTSSVMSDVGKDAVRLVALGAPIGSIANASIAINGRAISQWKELKSNIESTTESLKNFIAQRNWSSDPEKIQELYGQFTQKLALENQLDPKTAYYLQLLLEEGRTKATKEALVARMKDEYEAWKIETDEVAKMQLEASYDRHAEELNTFNQTTAKERVEWSEFTKYMANNHKSEIASMFRGMDEEQIKSLNFQEGEYKQWVDRMVKDYAKAHKMSYNEAFGHLKHWVQNANMWSIFIKLTISTEDGKSAFDALKELDQQVDDADAQIKRLERREKELSAIKKRTAEQDKELEKVTTELGQARADKKKAESEGGHGKQEDKDAKKAAAEAKKRAREAAKAQREAETELQKTLKNELSLIDKLRSSYKALTDEGVSQGRALEIVTSGFGETVKAINDVLVDKWGLAAFDPNKFAGISNPRELVKLLEDQLNALVKTGRAKPIEIQDLQTKVKDLKVDAAKVDTKMVAEGLNNELGKLKDEYELALEFDANPVMSDAFLSALGFDEKGADEFLNSLPHTFEKYAEKVQKSIADAITKESEATGASLSLFDITGGQTIEEWAKENDVLETSNLFKELKQGFEGFKNTLQKNLSDAFKSVDSYVEKYGSLQDKLLLIDKETDSQRRKINDAFYTEELRNTEEYQAAVSATERGAKEKTSKAYWEDFKSSDLYAMTFEDVKNTSTRAIDMILSKLAELKDKVKEDPASMKALTKAMEDLEKEKLNRDPFNGVSQSLKDMAAAAREAAAAKKELAEADEAVADAQEEVEVGMDVLNMFDGNTHEQTVAQEKLTRAKQRQAEAQKKLTAAENKGEKSQEQLISSLQGISGQLNSVKGLFDVVAELFSAGGDDETAEAIKGINEGFTIMTQVISAVGAALTILKSENPWLLAASAALSVIVGLVSFLSGNSNKKITEQVEESERAVKRLENTYKNLEHAATDAYGAQESGAKRALRASKELQLAEAQRQLQLEKSRKKKNRDEDKIIELEGQIIDLKNEINDATKDIVNDLLGISSAGDGIESMVSAMIDAFRNGEDVMKAFGDSFDEMVDNMILKLVVTQFMQKAWDNVLKNMQDKEEEMLKDSAEAQAAARQKVDSLSEMSDDEIRKTIAQENGDLAALFSGRYKKIPQAEVDAYRKAAEAALTNSTDALNDASLEYTKWSLDYMNTEGRDYLTQYATLLKDSLGEWYTYGENNEENLSNLQQGIQGITEDTAGALEAYMNGVSQQVYLHSELLTQIRDAVVGLDFDVQMATQAQMLLQLQNTYILMQSMHSLMDNWTVPSGNGIRVELVS